MEIKVLDSDVEEVINRPEVRAMIEKVSLMRVIREQQATIDAMVKAKEYGE